MPIPVNRKESKDENANKIYEIKKKLLLLERISEAWITWTFKMLIRSKRLLNLLLYFSLHHRSVLSSSLPFNETSLRMYLDFIRLFPELYISIMLLEPSFWRFWLSTLLNTWMRLHSTKKLQLFSNFAHRLFFWNVLQLPWIYYYFNIDFNNFARFNYFIGKNDWNLWYKQCVTTTL